MQTLTDTEQKWQNEALESFFTMVKAPDGDFEAIARLSKTLNEPESLKLSIEFVSRHQHS